MQAREDKRFLSPREVEVMMRLVRKVHAGELSFPPEIIYINQEIRRKTEQAKIFSVRFGQVDMFLVYEITDLRLLKDEVYTRWIREYAQLVT